MKKTSTRVGLWLVRKHPRTAARWGWKVMKNPRRSAMVAAAAKQAPDIARRARIAAQDPEVQEQLKVGRDALGKAAARLRSTSTSEAVADEKLRDELRRAVAAMTAGYAAAAQPKKRRRRFGRAVLAVGIVGAGAYAGYRAVCQTQNGTVHAARPSSERGHDETVAASFPASDPPPGPAA